MCSLECLRNPAARIETYYLCEACRESAPAVAATLPAAFGMGKTAASRAKLAGEAREWTKANNATALMARCLVARALGLPLP